MSEADLALRFLFMIMLVAVMVVIGAAQIVVPYYLSRKLLLIKVKQYKSSDAMTDFCRAEIIVSLVTFGLYCALGLFSLELVSIEQFFRPYRNGLVASFLLVMPLAPLVLMSFMALCSKVAQDAIERNALGELPPVPKFNFWLQDLMVFMLVQGCVASVCSQFLDERNLGLLVFLIAWEVVAMAIALDVCRRSELTKVARYRAAFVGGVLLFCAFPPGMLVSIYGWMAWRYVGWKVKVGEVRAGSVSDGVAEKGGEAITAPKSEEDAQQMLPFSASE